MKRPCRTCAARPALLHEPDCFECFQLRACEREVLRLGRALAAAERRAQRAEAQVARLRAKRTQLQRDRKRLNARRWRLRHLDARRAYNREWMRRFRERQGAA